MGGRSLRSIRRTVTQRTHRGSGLTLRTRATSSSWSRSRSASLTALVLRIPGVALLDYEHAEQRLLAAGNRVLWLPDLLRDEQLPPATRRIARYYEGLKENLYLDDWVFDTCSWPPRREAVSAVIPRPS